jgi:hypothetical protein
MIRFYEHVGTALLDCPAEQGSALSGVEVDVFLLHINDKAGFRSETGPTEMRMPRRQVTTIKLKRTPGRRGSQWEAGQVGGSVSATACSIKRGCPENTSTSTAGDRLLLFTDGITEACGADGEEFGEENLAAFAMANCTGTAAELNGRVVGGFTEFCAGRFQDDATVLVVAAR